MSSTTYSACLRPDHRLRRLTLRCGHALAALGTIPIFHLPLAARWQAVAAIVWVGSVLLQNRQLRRQWRLVRRIRVSPGGAVELIGPGREIVCGRLLAGSVLYPRFCWLRIVLPGGRVVSEPLLGLPRRCNNWRRLQVIWRHIGALD